MVEDKATDQWLGEQKVTTRYTYKTIFKHFMEYVKMNGDQILASRKEDKDRLWEKKVKEFNIEMRKTKSSSYVRSMMGAIRSFFEYHYVPLLFRTNTARKLVEAHRKTKDYLFTKEELYKMYECGDLVDRYIITVGKTFGLRSIDFIRLRRSDLEPYLNREPPIGIGELNTQKENVVAYPFLDADSIKIVKLMLEKLNAEGRTKPEDRILTFKKKMLTLHLQNLAEKIGINTNGRIIRFHNLRKFLFDRLTSVTSDTKAKMIVGKAISEQAYVSPELLREDFKRVIPLISFSTNGPSGVRIEELEQALQKEKDKVSMLMNVLGKVIKPKELEEAFEKTQQELNVALRMKRSNPTLEEIIEALSEAKEEE